MQKCKIKSVKSLGKQMTYNIAMKSSQHNYAIYDEATGKRVITSNSHSAAYSFIAYQTAWLKVYYGLEFMCNLLSSEIGNDDKMPLYLDQAKKMKIICMPEDINLSGLRFKIEKAKLKEGNKDVYVLRKPLTCLKGVGSKSVTSIVENQPYNSLEEFIDKIDARVVNIRVFETLVNQGCMDSWRTDGEELLIKYPEAKKKIEKDRKAKKKQQKHMEEYGGKSLFDDDFDYSGEKLNV